MGLWACGLAVLHDAAQESKSTFDWPFMEDGHSHSGERGGTASVLFHSKLTKPSIHPSLSLSTLCCTLILSISTSSIIHPSIHRPTLHSSGYHTFTSPYSPLHNTPLVHPTGGGTEPFIHHPLCNNTLTHTLQTAFAYTPIALQQPAHTFSTQTNYLSTHHIHAMSWANASFENILDDLSRLVMKLLCSTMTPCWHRQC